MTANDQHQPDAAPRLPVIYGYLRFPSPGTGALRHGDTPAEHVATVKTRMAEFCRQNAYVLGTVFTDQPSPGPLMDRPGFRGLLDVCELLGTYGVVLDSMADISPTSVVADLVDAKGRRIIFIPPPARAALWKRHYPPVITPGIVVSGDLSKTVDPLQRNGNPRNRRWWM